MSRTLPTLLAALCLAACGNGRGAKDSVDASPNGDLAGNETTEPADASLTGDLTAGAVKLCDGSDQVRLAVRIVGGGQSPAGTTMLAENGWRMLLVDGGCHAWVLRSHIEPLRELTLSAAQEATLSSALQLSTWQAFAGPHLGGCPDAPGITYRFADQHIQSPTCGLAAGDPLQNLNAMFSAQLDVLAAAASPITGDLRYLVVVESPSPSDSRPAVAWPLTTPIETVALSRGDEFLYRPGNSRLATGAEAAQLRAIRTTNQNGSTSTGSVHDFTRVRGTDGTTTYQLYVRDAAPREDANGLLPADTF